MSPRLVAENVTVRFGGLTALTDAHVTVEAGTVTGLIGPNGAGKTTFFDVITGMRTPVEGSVCFDGRDITRLSVYRRARMGIARTFQKLEVFGQLSVADNVRVAVEMRRRWNKDSQRISDEVRAILERVGIADIADTSMASVPTGTGRLVELARALATRPKVLLLDEPSSGLNDSETLHLAALLRSLTAEGLAVLLVEHDMSFVMGSCDRIFALDFGRIIAVGTPTEVKANPSVQAAYLGKGAEA